MRPRAAMFMVFIVEKRCSNQEGSHFRDPAFAAHLRGHRLLVSAGVQAGLRHTLPGHLLHRPLPQPADRPQAAAAACGRLLHAPSCKV